MKDKLLMLSIKFRTLLSDEQGQDLIEYALVVAMIALGATSAMQWLALNIEIAYLNIGASLQNALLSNTI
jgi:pilus assembly protein Flp/PilA